jgi:eukaryotic-like serine/threonine-protein kinase
MQVSSWKSRMVTDARSSGAYTLNPGDVLDGFEIREVLARGGMGSVLRAHRQSTGEDVVLKVPHLHLESDVVFYSRFEREGNIGLRLKHPGIVQTIAVPEKSRPYLVLEFVRGRSLRQVLDEDDTLSVERAVAIVARVCDALIYMHRRGVIHRDLKPENILIDDADNPTIVDFGIALDRSSMRVTWAGLSARLGTPDYIAPERSRGHRGDERVDIYALGLIFYEMLAGVLPRRTRTRSEPRPLSEVVPEIDPGLAEVVMRALARRPSDRFADATEMLAALHDPTAMSRRRVASDRGGNRAGTVATLLGWLGWPGRKEI